MGKILLSLLIVIIAGCTPTTVKMPLSTSLGLETFSSMGTIERRNVSIGLHIEHKLKELILIAKLPIDTSGEKAVTKFYVGENFTVRLIKALAYNVNKLKLLDQPYPSSTDNLDATMIVELQEADIIAKYVGAFYSSEWSSESWLTVKATLKDNETGNIVWVGTTRAESKGTFVNASIGMSITIERAVAQLVRQISESENYAKYVGIWEGKKHD